MEQLTNWALYYRDMAKMAFEHAQECMDSYIRTLDAYYLTLYYDALDVVSGYAELYNREVL